METQSSTPELTVPQEPSPKAFDEKAEKAQLKSVLSEARNTRDVLVGFRSAIESGTFEGVRMMDLAKGLAFLDAILNQNQGHIKSLQERIGG